MQEPLGPEFKRLIWEKNKQHGWKVAQKGRGGRKTREERYPVGVEVIETYQSAFTREKNPINTELSRADGKEKEGHHWPGVVLFVCMYVFVG